MNGSYNKGDYIPLYNPCFKKRGIKVISTNFVPELTTFGIYMLAFVEYLKEDNHVLYIGILFVIISVILYLFNITSK